MKKLFSVILICLITFGIAIGVANLSSKKAHAAATFGTWEEVWFLGIHLWSNCEDTPTDCVDVYPDE